MRATRLWTSSPNLPLTPAAKLVHPLANINEPFRDSPESSIAYRGHCARTR